MNMSSPQVLPLSVVIPTRYRPQILARTLNAFQAQDSVPAEWIIIDASADDTTEAIVRKFEQEAALASRVIYQRAEVPGAAVQRNQGVVAAREAVIGFMDDDIVPEPECLRRLWDALNAAPDIGGANAMITNQRYHSPGRVSRIMFRLMGGTGPPFAGKVLGPVVNLLPEDREDLPAVVPVDWLNTTCTLYRRDALPNPPFSSHFTGYSLMEDVTVSSVVGRRWKLVNARTARIFHDSQPGSHKADVAELAAMELINRHYVMTEVLGRRGLLNHVRLVLWELFQLTVAGLRRESRASWWPMWRGKLRAVRQLIFQ